MTEKIIVKREKEGNYIIFFPETVKDFEGRDEILCFTRKDGHNNATFGYVYSCEHVEYLAENVVKFVADYVRYVQTLPDMADYKIKMVKRITR